LSQDKALIDVETLNVPDPRILPASGQIIVAQKLFLGRSASNAETVSWNILHLGKVLDTPAQTEGQFVLSPAFELADGSIYTLKVTLFAKGKRPSESKLVIAAVPNQQEQEVEQVDRYCARISARTFKTQKGQPAKIM